MGFHLQHPHPTANPDPQYTAAAMPFFLSFCLFSTTPSHDRRRRHTTPPGVCGDGPRRVWVLKLACVDHVLAGVASGGVLRRVLLGAIAPRGRLRPDEQGKAKRGQGHYEGPWLVVAGGCVRWFYATRLQQSSFHSVCLLFVCTPWVRLSQQGALSLHLTHKLSTKSTPVVISSFVSNLPINLSGFAFLIPCL